MAKERGAKTIPELDEALDFENIVVDDGTHIGKRMTKGSLKALLTIEGTEMEPLVGGTTSGTALVVPNGPAGEQRTAEVSSGKWYDFGSGPVEASADRRWKSYWNGTSWVLKDMGELPTADLTDVAKTELKPGKNLIDPSTIDFTKKYSPGNNAIIARDGVQAVTVAIPVIEGKTYTVSTSVPLPSGVGHSGGYFINSSTLSSVDDISFLNTTGGNAYKFTVPTGLNIKFVRINVLCQGNIPNNTLIGNYQLEKGDVATAYEAYSATRQLASEDTPTYLKEENVPTKQEVEKKVDAETILVEESFNKINPLTIDFTKKFSPAGTGVIALRDGTFAITAFMPVEEDAWYTFSIDTGAMPTFHGGYFANSEATTGIQVITWVNPVSGTGRCFKVPTGLGIKGIRLNVICTGNPPINTLIGNFQLEKGEMATPFRPFDAKLQFNPSLLPSNQQPQPSGNFDARAWYTFTEGEQKTVLLKDKAPNFFSYWLTKLKDLIIEMVGTSHEGRTDEFTSVHPKANERPPLMHSMNTASIMYDKMKWDNQFYRRYDYPSYFTEIGSFATASDLAEWDDGPYRKGLTRYSSSTNAGITFKIPVDAWQFNFIYRTDSLGVQQNKVTIADGNGLVQVFDESDNTWKEANGFIFSMRESAPIARDIQVPSPSTGNFTTLNFATKSNTTYQKRLKMRCKAGIMDSRHFSKSVTIQAQTTGRFMYWGVEWSIRQFMLTFINASRGSYGTDAAGIRGLPRVADNEVWAFKPDLMFFELPIHNDGASNASAAAGGYWWRLTNNYIFNPDYELSMVRRSQDLNGYVPEMVIYTSVIALNFGGINNDGSLKLGQQNDASMMSALDKYNQAYDWVNKNHPEVAFVNMAQRWVQAGMAIFGSMKLATEGSGNTGATFTNEGSHPNDTGSKIKAKALTGVFEFV